MRVVITLYLLSTLNPSLLVADSMIERLAQSGLDNDYLDIQGRSLDGK